MASRLRHPVTWPHITHYPVLKTRHGRRTLVIHTGGESRASRAYSGPRETDIVGRMAAKNLR